MIRADLKDARRKWIDEAGENAEERKAREKSDFLTYVNADGEVFDFYAQRGQMITALEQSGVSLKTLQALARHSRVETTLKHYARKPISTVPATMSLTIPVNLMVSNPPSSLVVISPSTNYTPATSSNNGTLTFSYTTDRKRV